MHRFIPTPDAPPAGIDPTHTDAIRRWTTEFLHLADNAVVSVRETACADSGCPLVETQVLVLEGRSGTRAWRFTRSRAAITRLILHQVLASPPERRNQT